MSDYLELGLWESLVLELPDGVRREFVIKKAKKVQDESTPISIAQDEIQNSPVLVVTRSHAKADELRKRSYPSGETSEGVPRPKTQGRPSKPNLQGNRVPRKDDITMEQPLDQPIIAQSGDSRSSFGGSVLVDKVNETLDNLLKAYEARVRADTIIPPKLKEYPDPIQEKVNLVKHQALIRDTQTTLDGSPPYVSRNTTLPIPLETIREALDEDATSSQRTRVHNATYRKGEQIAPLANEAV